MINSHPFKPDFWSTRRGVVLLVLLATGYPYEFGSDPASAIGAILGVVIVTWALIVIFNRARELVGRIRQPHPDSG